MDALTKANELNKQIKQIQSERGRREGQRQAYLQQLKQGCDSYAEEYGVELWSDDLNSMGTALQKEADRERADLERQVELQEQVVAAYQRGDLDEMRRLVGEPEPEAEPEVEPEVAETYEVPEEVQYVKSETRHGVGVTTKKEPSVEVQPIPVVEETPEPTPPIKPVVPNKEKDLSFNMGFEEETPEETVAPKKETTQPMSFSGSFSFGSTEEDEPEEEPESSEALNAIKTAPDGKMHVNLFGLAGEEDTPFSSNFGD